MKRCLFIFSIFLLGLSFQQIPSNVDLLCRKWKQVGLKPFKGNYTPIESPMAITMEFCHDGTYNQAMSIMEFNGVWRFNADSTKFVVAFTHMNGKPIKNLSIDDDKPVDFFIKLTSDTLIYGSEAYYGPEKVFGYSENYYVAVK